MKPHHVAVVAGLVLAASQGISQGHAQNQGAASGAAPASGASTGGGDLAALGAAIATQGAPGIAPCSSCHGAQGEGQAAAGFPRLAGQPWPYLERQLQAYAEDHRTNPVMQPIAKAMTPQQRAAAAQHYGRIVAPATEAAASAPPAATQRLGRTLAVVGAPDRLLQACSNCHGPDGIGEWATYPALAGQHATYLRNALAEWKDGSRRTDASEQMPRIAKLLSDAETNAVVAYFAALPPPARSRQFDANASTPRSGTTVVSGPTNAGRTAPSQGTGTEQGAPVAGGTQGVGGPGNPTGPQSGAPTGSGAPAPGASTPQR
jgi:cytochrome c553